MADPTTPSGSLGFALDQRVHALGDPRRTGTVRYIGPVDGYAGDWIGVDWDDAEGKHDGVVNGVRYFAAREARSGSLVRPKNLSGGISILDALQLRYRGDYTKQEEDEMYVFSTRKKRVSVQLVGKDKIQERLNHFEEMISASIAYMGVSTVGSEEEISAAVPNLKELDMAGNLLSNWQDVGAICNSLPALEILNLTDSHIDKGITDLPLLKNIRILILNNCGITWKEVDVLKRSLPAIEELHLMGNKLKIIMNAPCSPMINHVEGFDSLKVLNLDDNNVDSWDEILRLSQLRRLEQLYLNKNKLKHFFYPSCKQEVNTEKDHKRFTRAFENLHCLLLGCNEIEDSASVDSLNSFPILMDVRLSGNPVTDLAKGGMPRYILVARLAKVKMLNGSEVSQRERKESEIRYVRHVMAKMLSGHPEDIKQSHPRFTELKILHGIDDEKSSDVRTGPQKMASTMLSITLKCVGASFGERPPLTKKLPPTTTVGRLKSLCESFFKLKSMRPRLFLEEEGSPLPLLLDEEMASLMDLGISCTATILVDEEV